MAGAGARLPNQTRQGTADAFGLAGMHLSVRAGTELEMTLPAAGRSGSQPRSWSTRAVASLKGLEVPQLAQTLVELQDCRPGGRCVGGGVIRGYVFHRLR